jgi:hypothetical protein
VTSFWKGSVRISLYVIDKLTCRLVCHISRIMCSFCAVGLTATLQLRAEPKTKNDKDYWDVVHFSVDIHSLQDLKIHFENLFNGDKTLSKYNCMQPKARRIVSSGI